MELKIERTFTLTRINEDTGVHVAVFEHGQIIRTWNPVTAFASPKGRPSPAQLSSSEMTLLADAAVKLYAPGEGEAVPLPPR